MFIRTHKSVCGRIGVAMLLMMVTWMGTMMIVQAIIMVVNMDLLQNAWVTWLLNDVPLYLFGVPVFLLVLKGVPDGPRVPREKTRIGVGRYLMILVFGMGATYLFNLIMMGIIIALQTLATGELGTGNNALAEMVSMGGFWPTFLFGVCVPALGEEFIFRYTLRRKMAGCADITYILLSSLCFAVFHMNVIQAPYAFVLGVAFAWLYLVTDNIWLPVSLHFLVNLLGTTLMPMLTESEVGSMVAGLLMIALIAAAIAIFVTQNRKVRATLQPPTEPGWYYKPPRRPLVAAPPPAPAPILPSAMPPLQGAPAAVYGEGRLYGEGWPYGEARQSAPPAYGATPPPYGAPVPPAPPTPPDAAQDGWQPPQPPPGWQQAPNPYAPPQAPYTPNAPLQAPPYAPPQAAPYAPQQAADGQQGPYATQAPYAPPQAPYYAPPQAPYGQPQYTQPPPVPYQAYPGQPYPGQPYPPPAPRGRAPSNLGFSLRNAGMILYLVLGGIMSAVTLLTTIFLMA